ncbi:MAG: DUF2905 family protein [Candidatus Omnitrophica bacterium]|nr:DUF2905 family protein [Candidatus Omnitrophota bacterium]
MNEIGKFLVAAGLVIAGIGLLLFLSGRVPWIGRLPGDIIVRKEGFRFYLPLTTCLLISVVISFVLWIIRR